MADTLSIHTFLQLSLLVSLLRLNSATRLLHPNSANKPAPKSRPHPPPLNPHNNRPFLLTGKITIHLIWYGTFTPPQRAIVSDFIASLCFPDDQNPQSPATAAWRKALATGSRSSSVVFRPLGTETTDEGYSLGKSLTNQDIIELASRGGRKNAINVVLTSPDVGVDGFCSRRCGARGSAMGAARVSGKTSKFAYVWVGNAETECPGRCAWPASALVSPNRDVGMEGIVMNLARLLVKTVMDPLSDGNLRMV